MLSDISILITTFLRDGYLFDCVNSISKNLPECEIVVVDDGKRSTTKDIFYDKILQEKHTVAYMDFDSGLSAKRNRGVELATRKYVLLGCDDFDFSTIESRIGISLLSDILDKSDSISIASGHVNNHPYEGFLNLENGVLTETSLCSTDPFEMIDGYKVYPVDLSVNYFLARKEVLLDNPWDARMKIGGEHGDFFLQLKRKNIKTVLVPGVNVNTFVENKTKVDPTYSQYRGRARELGHKIYLEKNGITKFVSFSDNGVVNDIQVVHTGKDFIFNKLKV